MDVMIAFVWSARSAVMLVALAGLFAAGCEEDKAKKQGVAVTPYSASGLIDFGFNGQGFITIGNATAGANRDDEGHALALDANGNILVAGKRSQAGGGDLGDMAVWRLVETGTLDATFGTNGVTTYDSGGGNLDVGYAMTLDSKGRIVVAGTTTAAGESDEFTAWRLNGDGTFDTTFNTTGTRVVTNVGGGNGSDLACGVAVDASDRVLVAGAGINAGDSNAFLLRLRAADGGDDNTFGTNSKVNVSSGAYDDFSGVMVDGNGNIVTVGWENPGTGFYPVVRRWLGTTGALDATFSPTGTPSGSLALTDMVSTNPNAVLLNTYHFRVREDAAGNIVVAGTMDNPGGDDNAILYRITPAGVLDTSFGGTGYVRLADSKGGIQRARDFTFDTQGRLLVAGEAQLSGLGAGVLWMTVWRLLPNGLLDDTFGVPIQPGSFPGVVQLTAAAGGATGDVGNAVRVDSKGRIVIAGYSGSATNGREMTVWRLQ